MTINKNIEWWREARFGMFIHWGIYSATEGFWNGVETKGIGEWIQCREQIPLSEYGKYAEKITLEKFNAKEWVGIAKEAGCKYIVLTAKHHEGFAMFDSKCSDYNVVKMGPSHRDPSMELTEAAYEVGLKMCFYYSQALDWEDRDAVGNNWDYNKEEKDFSRYLEGKCKHQLKELLTGYGDIGLIWFDTPVITREQSLNLKDYVKSLQPTCLVSGRINGDQSIGDYGSMGDNQIPKGRVEGDWETAATLNHTWGYKRKDNGWKSADDMIRLLVDLISKGVNCLLNIGPKANGEIPYESIKILNEIGEWMKINGEAIYGTTESPFLTDFDWGCSAKKGNDIYLYIKTPSEFIQLAGIRNSIKKISLLSDKNLSISYEEYHDKIKDEHSFIIATPIMLENNKVKVIKLELEGEVDVIDYIQQQPNNGIRLPAYLSTIHKEFDRQNCKQMSDSDSAISAERHNLKSEQDISVGPAGVVENWYNTSDYLEWEFTVYHPFDLEIELRSLAKKYEAWVGGHKVRIECNGQVIRKILTEDIIPEGSLRVYFSETGSNIGIIHFNAPGRYKLKLFADAINDKDPVGLVVSDLLLKSI